MKKLLVLIALLLPMSVLADGVSSFRLQYQPTKTSTELSYASDTKIYDNDFLVAVEEGHDKTIHLESMLHMLEFGYVFSLGNIALNVSSSISVSGDFENDNNQLNAAEIREPIFQQEMTSFSNGVILNDFSRFNGQVSVAYHFGSFNLFGGYKVEQSMSEFDVSSIVNIGEGTAIGSQVAMTLDDVASGPYVGVNSIVPMSTDNYLVLNATLSQYTGGHLILDGDTSTFNETTSGTGYSLGVKWSLDIYSVGLHYKGYESDDGGDLKNTRSDVGLSIGVQFL